MTSGKQAKSLYHESTIQSADCIESHPTIAGLFALGTYQVDQHKQNKDDTTREDENQVESSSSSPEYSRKGMLRLKGVKVSSSDGSLSSENVAEIETAAVLDMKWLHPSSSLLSLALADSNISLYSYKDNTLTPVKSIKINTTQALCLSLDWSDRIGGFKGGYNIEDTLNVSEAIISQSDGNLSHLSNYSSSSSPIIKTWKAHEYEAWTCAYDCWSLGNVVWSGGDDLCLKGWDLRKKNDLETSIFTVKKCFEGGVTSMQSHHLKQHLWAVGSYDGQLRLFDARKVNRPISTTQVDGGIWRTKWHPTMANRLLLGCMHDGFKVMQLDSLTDESESLPDQEMQVRTRFDEHESLAYGCDWDRGQSFTHENLIYSCSFYDSKWHAWKSKE